MIKDNLLSEIKAYCEANNIENVDELINNMLTRGFAIEKFGETPANRPPKVIEKTVEVEVIKEVPVEVIKEVEKVIEKEVKVSDDSKIEELIAEHKKEVAELEDTIKVLKDNRKEQTQAIMRCNKEKDILKEEFDAKLAEIEAQMNKEEDKPKDLYGETDEERPKGFFGSNIANLKWPKKKQ